MRARSALPSVGRAAGFPVLKTLGFFDSKAQPSINKALVLELMRGDYIANNGNVLFMGNPGTGKTHLATAPGHAACARGKRVRFAPPSGAGGFGGLTMSLDGGLGEVEEFLGALASSVSSTAMRQSCPAMRCSRRTMVASNWRREGPCGLRLFNLKRSHAIQHMVAANVSDSLHRSYTPNVIP